MSKSRSSMSPRASSSEAALTVDCGIRGAAPVPVSLWPPPSPAASAGPPARLSATGRGLSYSCRRRITTNRRRATAARDATPIARAGVAATGRGIPAVLIRCQQPVDERQRIRLPLDLLAQHPKERHQRRLPRFALRAEVLQHPHQLRAEVRRRCLHAQPRLEPPQSCIFQEDVAPGDRTHVAVRRDQRQQPSAFRVGERDRGHDGDHLGLAFRVSFATSAISPRALPRADLA